MIHDRLFVDLDDIKMKLENYVSQKEEYSTANKCPLLVNTTKVFTACEEYMK